MDNSRERTTGTEPDEALDQAEFEEPRGGAPEGRSKGITGQRKMKGVKDDDEGPAG